jgi:3-hydroxybutyryl-CoA dehydrogenase
MTDKIIIGIAGSGTMGTGIAIVAARGGFPTILFDVDAARVAAAMAQMKAFFAKSVLRAKLTQDQVDEIMDRVIGTSDMQAMATCGLVIEAIFEELKIKGKLFAGLNEVCAPEALFASNTSTLSITEIAAHYDVTLALYEALGNPAYVPPRRAHVAKAHQLKGI